MKVTTDLEREIRKTWGDPKQVARIVFKEINAGYFCQIDCAIQLGILLGELKNGDVSTFIERLRTEEFERG